MKQCLHCKKEFQEQKETAKYCSTSCRVMFNRNKPKKPKGISPESKLEVLYNAVLDAVSKINYSPITPSSYDGAKINTFIDELPMFPTKYKIRRSYENYEQLKIACPSIEDWLELKEEILNSDLTDKQKIKLTT